MAQTVAVLEVLLRASSRDLTRGLSNAQRDIGNFSTRAGRSLTGIGTAITANISAPLAVVQAAVSRFAINWESDFAGVLKTVDGTQQQMDALEQTLRDLATATDAPVAGMRNAQHELARIAELAGQLGVGINAIDEFAEVIGELTLATDLTSESASLMLAQFANITGLDVETDLRGLADVIVHLGNNMATTERNIVEFMQRLAGASTGVGFSERQIAALAATLASVGLRAEASGTSMTTLLLTIEEAAASATEGFVNSDTMISNWQGNIDELTRERVEATRSLAAAQESYNNALEQGSARAGPALTRLENLQTEIAALDSEIAAATGNLADYVPGMTLTFSGASDELRAFADVAGISAQDFADAWENDPQQALQSFLEGFDELTGGEQIATLDALGLSGIRVSDMIRRLSGNTELLSQAFGMVGSEAEGALGAEAARRFETTAARMNLFMNNIRELGIVVGSTLLPSINAGLTRLTAWTQRLQELDPWVHRLVARLISVGAVLGPVVFGIGKFLAILGMMVASPIVLVISAIVVGVAALASGFKLLAEYSLRLSNAIGFFGNALGNAFGAIGPLVSAFGRLALAIIEFLWPAIDLRDFIQSVGDRIASFFIDLSAKLNIFTGSAGTATDTLNRLTNFIDSVRVATDMLDISRFDLLGQAIGQFFRNIVPDTNIDFDFEKLFSGLGAAQEDPEAFARGLINAMTGGKSAQEIQSGLVSEIEAFMGGVDFDAIGTWLADHATSLLGIALSLLSGPVGMAIGVGKLIGLAVQEDLGGIGKTLENLGILSTLETAATEIQALISTALNSIFGEGDVGIDSEGLLDFAFILQPLVDAFNNAKEGLAPALESIGPALKTFFDIISNVDKEGVEEFLREVAVVVGQIVNVAGAVLEGAASGLAAALPGIGNAIVSFFDIFAAVRDAKWPDVINSSASALLNLVGALLQFPLNIASEIATAVFGEEFTSRAQTLVDALSAMFNNLPLIVQTAFERVRIWFALGIAQMEQEWATQVANSQVLQFLTGMDEGTAREISLNMNIQATQLENTATLFDQLMTGNLDEITLPTIVAGMSANAEEALRLEAIPPAIVQNAFQRALEEGHEGAYDILEPISTAMNLGPFANPLEIQEDVQTEMTSTIQAGAYDAGIINVATRVRIVVTGVDSFAVAEAVAGASGGGAGGPINTNDDERTYQTGTWRVPSTGLAMLHRGERVLNNSEARQYERGRGGGGNTLNIYGQSAYDVARMVESAMADRGA